MQHAIGFLIALPSGVSAEEFETAFPRIIEESNADRVENAEFRLYRTCQGPSEYLWLTRFPDHEFDRVSRAAWPFVVLEIREILLRVRERFAPEISTFSAPTKSLSDVEDEWNHRFGRFTKLSLEPARPSAGA